MRNILFIAICGVIFAGPTASLRAQDTDPSVRSVDPSVDVRIDDHQPQTAPSYLPVKKQTTSATWAPTRKPGLWHSSDHSLDSLSPSAAAHSSFDPQVRVRPDQPSKPARDSATEKHQKFAQSNFPLSEPGQNDDGISGSSTTPENAIAASYPKHGTNMIFPSFNRNAVGTGGISLFPETKALHAGSTLTPSRKRSANTSKSENDHRQAASDPRHAAK
jgi:hypothetical protein